ncbi:MAG TPA: response regulator [Actinophytocola sp.]|jgi:signal transduction histidine kinase/CheY-like chemotaxis protein|uniref:response regulator n=1 Tax=Actinophytocola sp. TaxID=1872138 RepID=UPI002F92C591
MDASDRLRSLFDGPDRTAAALRATDWSRTPLGPVETWSDELCAAIRTVLPSRIPMLLWWGPQLLQIFNDAYTPLLGDKYPDAIGQPAAECWREIWAELGPLAETAMSGEGATYAENLLLLMRRHGYLEETYWTFSYSPVRAADGTIAGIFVATADETERVLSDRRMETLRGLGTLSTAVAQTASDACRGAVEVLARSRADVPLALAYLRNEESGEPALVASMGVREGGEIARDVVARVLDTGETAVLDDIAARFPGVHVPGGGSGDAPVDRTLVVPLLAFGRSRPAGVLVLGVSPYRALDLQYRVFAELVAGQVSTALTDALAYEAERARAAALAELDAAKTRFFENVSHEFRTPLTLLLGPLETVLDQHGDRLPAPAREALATAHRAALRLQRLVDTLLDVVRAEADELYARPEPTNVAHLTEDCVSMFRSAAETAGVELIVEISDEVRATGRMVVLDREMWAKIVLNLMSNAVKFTDSGSITVILSSESGRLVLAVADTGVGIPPGELGPIFDRFHQVAGTSGRSREGTGIGLSLVRDLAAAMGGTVEVTSIEGAGSTFTVSVPEKVQHAAGPEGDGHRPELAKAFAGEAAQWRPAAPVPDEPGGILLVEDNADMRDYLTRVLAEQGWPVRAVGDADAAMAHARANRPELILSDVMLPGRDGLALLREIRAVEPLNRVPVVLLTARAGAESAVDGLRAGADDYVVKPFHRDELISRVRSHLELFRLREQVVADNEREAVTLRGALDSRSTVSQAVGLLMATHRCAADTAFQQLVAVSQATNRKVRDIAATVVADFTAELTPSEPTAGA